MEQTEIKFFTTDGSDVWVFKKLRLVVDLRNAITGETVTCEKSDPRFRPAEIRVAENKIRANKTKDGKAPVKREKLKVTEVKSTKVKPGGGAGRELPTGVYTGKRAGSFKASFWDRTKKKNISLGTFDSIAAAAEARTKAMGTAGDINKPEPTAPKTLPIAKSDKKKIPKNRSEYAGVVRAASGRFYASYWSRASNKQISLGTFEYELLAAAAVQEAKGNHKEAMRLRNEHQEGDGGISAVYSPDE